MTEDVTLHEEAIVTALRDPDTVVNADVYRYLEYQDRSDYLPTEFFKDGDLESYRAACAWWPTPKNLDDMPWAVRKPLLEQLCFNYAADPRETFMERLSAWAQRADAWAKQHLHKPGAKRIYDTLPGETEDERQRRLNRERVARHRQSRALQPYSGPNAAVAETRAKLREAKAQYKAAMVQWRVYINHLESEVLAAELAAKETK